MINNAPRPDDVWRSRGTASHIVSVPDAGLLSGPEVDGYFCTGAGCGYSKLPLAGKQWENIPAIKILYTPVHKLFALSERHMKTPLLTTD